MLADDALGEDDVARPLVAGMPLGSEVWLYHASALARSPGLRRGGEGESGSLLERVAAADDECLEDPPRDNHAAHLVPVTTIPKVASERQRPRLRSLRAERSERHAMCIFE